MLLRQITDAKQSAHKGIFTTIKTQSGANEVTDEDLESVDDVDNTELCNIGE